MLDEYFTRDLYDVWSYFFMEKAEGKEDLEIITNIENIFPESRKLLMYFAILGMSALTEEIHSKVNKEIEDRNNVN